MSAANNKLIAGRWLEAFNKKNIDALLALYHPNASHYSPKLKIKKPATAGLIKGKEALGLWWKEAFDRIPSLKYGVNNLVASDEAVFMEYTRSADGEEDLMVGELLEIKNGLIIFSRVYHG
jgi:hypothetical protein